MIDTLAKLKMEYLGSSSSNGMNEECPQCGNEEDKEVHTLTYTLQNKTLSCSTMLICSECFHHFMI